MTGSNTKPFQVWVTRDGKYYYSNGWANQGDAQRDLGRIQSETGFKAAVPKYRAQLRHVQLNGDIAILETVTWGGAA